MNRSHSTARELATDCLPSLPTSERGIQLLAQREGWTGQKRAGTKATEYAHASLPDAVRTALIDAQIAALPKVVCPLPTVPKSTAIAVIESRELPPPASLKGWQRRAMDARCGLLMYLQELTTSHGMSRSVDCLVASAKAGALPAHIQQLVALANARSGKTGKRTLSRSSLLRWKRERAAAGGNAVALAPIDQAREAVAPWVPYFLKCYRKPQKPSVPDALAELAGLIPPYMTMPTESQCYRILTKMSAVDRERGRCTGNELRALQGFRRRDTSDMVPCEVYQCDGHSFKARVAHPVHGKPFHPELCAVIDAATRMVMGWSAGLSESNQTVADALRHACTIDEEKGFGGIPAIFYTDPGSGNLANVNADPVLGRYARLGITFKTGIVGNSQARGMVERLQQTLWIKAAKQLPTYTGKDMDHTTEYKTSRLVDSQVKKTGKADKLPSWPQFLDLCRQAVERYNHTPHRSLAMIVDDTGHKRHMTPAEAYAGHLANGWVPPTMNALEIDDCFRPRVEVTTRRAEVRVFGNTYYHKELEHHGGSKVLVEYQVQDGSKVWVRDQQERLICIAGFESNKSGMFERSALDVAAEQRMKRRLALVENHANEIREERNGVIDYTPPALKIAEARAELIAMEEEEQNVVEMPTTDVSRWRYHNNLQGKIEQGEAISERDRTWLETYRRSSTYRSFAAVEADLAITQ